MERQKTRRPIWTFLLVAVFVLATMHSMQNDRLLVGTETQVQVQSKLEQSVVNFPIGSLGPKGSGRQDMLYYDFLYLLSMKYGASAKRLLEVGCAGDPFAQHLDWIDDKACLAPYFVQYTKGQQNNVGDQEKSIQSIEADFMEWDNPEHKTYDLVVCNQVLEHVPDPRGFLQKLITTAKQATIISVPYLWPVCTGKCGHLTHNISLDTVKQWAAPYKPVYHTIITEHVEKGGSSNTKRLFAVFQR